MEQGPFSLFPLFHLAAPKAREVEQERKKVEQEKELLFHLFGCLLVMLQRIAETGAEE